MTSVEENFKILQRFIEEKNIELALGFSSILSNRFNNDLDTIKIIEKRETNSNKNFVYKSDIVINVDE